MSASLVELKFQLAVDDGWPPVAMEALWCMLTPAGYLLESIPLFVQGLSVGDVIDAAPDAEGRVWEWEQGEGSNRSTIWLLRLASPGSDAIAAALDELHALNCTSTGVGQLGCYALDVPPECPLGELDAVLARLDPAAVAVAYPSLRHHDYSES